jgi:autotransporter-associated beta strand protein
VSISKAAAAVTFNNLSGQSSSNVTLGAQSLVLHNTQNSSYPGSIAGSGSVTKTGQGELSLSGVSGYQGGTFLQQGSLNIGDSSALGTGVFSLDDGTSAILQSDVTLANDIVFPAGVATLSVGNIASLSGGSSGSGSFAKVGSGKLVINGDFMNTGVNQISAGQVKVVGSVTSGFDVAAGGVCLAVVMWEMSLLAESFAPVAVAHDCGEWQPLPSAWLYRHHTGGPGLKWEYLK